MDFNRKNGVYRMLDNILPDVSSDKYGVANDA